MKLFTHGIHCRFVQHALVDKALRIDVAWVFFLVNRTIHFRLSPARLIAFVMSVLAVTPNINHHIFFIFLTVFRRKMVETGKELDWAMGEAMAFATLLKEGFPVRLSGQDCIRGTFSQRHAGIVDQKTGNRHIPMNLQNDSQAKLEVLNSNLSEFAVMGFEYGYSSADPSTLTLWEGQFGDFVNGAQIIIDQFISSGEAKWLRMSGLVLLLPHGYEGQGPEHSSARMERFLQQCAEDNQIVANCTTPANYFHILRRQMLRDFRKPLMLFTPKSLLRHKRATSSFKDMEKGTTFKRIIGETEKLVASDKVRRVVLCTGKVYYELLQERENKKIKDIALIRVEQLYPFPEKALAEELKKYKNAEVIWCQEEPQNMGAWQFVDRRIEDALTVAKVKAKRPNYAGRKAGASPACGYMKIHKKEQEALITEALK
jgi:2-oxoglutarate dehydrogenase E1 component